MASYARIDQGRVAELVTLDGDPATMFHESLVFAPAPEGCAVGWHATTEGDVLVLAPPPVDLEALRATKRAAIDAAYAAAVARGLPFGEDDGIQIDAESRQNIAARATRAGFVIQETAGFTWPQEGLPYRSRNNVWVLFTPTEMVAMSLQAADLFTAIRIRYAVLKGACAMADAVGLAAIDETAGWPN